ncbi:MAG: ribosomal RNA small subunit methyltransferase A [Oscillospiraceae bacterium]|nr:ribosomal RNA small subunit methyltransferase A [Oscillospiraceae bacterium]
MDLCDPRVIRVLLEKNGFRFSRAMGQNFLIDPTVPERIAEAADPGPEDGVLEIGPGIGTLTVRLAERAGRVCCVELDRTLLPILAKTLAGYGNVTVVSGDILKTDLRELAERVLAGRRLSVCANLPYNITTPVLTRLLESGLFERLTVMIQREVAARICARPGTADYGAFTLFCDYHARAERLFDVPPGCFMPAPKVTSTVIRLTPRPAPPEVEDRNLFFRTVRASFAQRRKTLVNGLAAAFPLPKAELADALTACGLDERTRGEALSPEQFAAVAREVGARLGKKP